MFRDFDAALKEKTGGRPTFKLGGQTFTCRAKLPWRKFSGMLLALQSGVRPEGKTDLDQTEDFFSMVLIPADRERFLKMLNKEDIEEDEDEESVIDNADVGQLLDWLMKYYLGTDEEEEEKPVVETVELPADVTPQRVDISNGKKTVKDLSALADIS